MNVYVWGRIKHCSTAYHQVEWKDYPYSYRTGGGIETDALKIQNNEHITGWVCPLCGRVFSPTVTECESCNENKTTIYETKLEVK